MAKQFTRLGLLQPPLLTTYTKYYVSAASDLDPWVQLFMLIRSYS